MHLQKVMFWRTKADKKADNYELGIMINNDEMIINISGKIVTRLYDYNLQPFYLNLHLSSIILDIDKSK